MSIESFWWLMVPVTLLWAGVAVAHVLLWRTLPRLQDLPPEMPDGRPWPRISILVPSCNEEKAVEAATRSLLQQDHPNLEIVAINDRSTDRTGEILENLRKEFPALTVVHIKELPPGWLGKNHANHQGASQASGDWLLFTDGDVLFSPDALRRAMAFAERHALGHLVALPYLLAPGFFERAAQTASFALISTRFRTWELRRNRSRGYVGVGAFNLVRRDAYASIGGHAGLALEVADDMKMGMMLRRSGIRQGMVDSGGAVRVRWQEGFLNSFRGILKNAFSGADWQWWVVGLAAVAMPLLNVFPLVAAVAAPTPWLQALGVLSALIGMGLHGFGARRVAGGSGLEGLTQPIMAMLLLGTIVLSAVLATVRGGIMWRGTFYPLGALRRGCVRERDWPTDRVVGWKP